MLRRSDVGGFVLLGGEEPVRRGTCEERTCEERNMRRRTCEERNL